MRSVSVIALVAGCSFRPGAGPVDDSMQPDAPIAGDDAPAPTDSTIDPRVACSASDPAGLVVCYEFEDDFADGTLLDSTPAHRDAATTGMTEVKRGTSGAATITSQAKTYAPQTTALDLKSAYTIAMWVHPRTFPGDGGADGLADHEGQYAMGIVDSIQDGLLELRCINTNSDHEYVGMTTSASWSLVVCTYDGNSLCAHRFTSSGNKDSFCHSGAGAPATTGTSGLAVGHFSDQGQPVNRFDGDIDSLQIYGRALSRADVCAIAAQPSDCFD